MIKKFKFDYDYENDDLFMYDPKSKSKASVEMDDLIIDYNAKKEISAIELLNASQFFKGIVPKGFKMSKDRLRDISECRIEIVPKKNFFMLKLIFMMKSKEELSAPIILPSIHESSPAVIV